MSTNNGTDRADLASLTIGRADARLDAMLPLVNKYGMCIVRDWLSPDELNVLREEHERALSSDSEAGEEGVFNGGRVARLKRAAIHDDYPNIFKLFSDPVFEELSRQYIRQPFAFNDDIFVTDHGPDKREILPLHYDRLWCLKFYVYLKDTTVNDGAFEAVPGSHDAVRKRRNHLLSRGVKAQMLPNRTDYTDLTNSTPVEGAAGTLIIFDTDTLHKGGVVGEGGRRLVFRGHTHCDPTDVYRPKPWTSQWVREHPLNPVTALRRLSDVIREPEGARP